MLASLRGRQVEGLPKSRGYSAWHSGHSHVPGGLLRAMGVGGGGTPGDGIRFVLCAQNPLIKASSDSGFSAFPSELHQAP